jgi:hypothetical protein
MAEYHGLVLPEISDEFGMSVPRFQDALFSTSSDSSTLITPISFNLETAKILS